MSIFQKKQSTGESSETEATQQEEKDTSYEQSVQAEKSTVFSTSRFVTGVLRMIGFDATKLGALAINALMLFAQTVSRISTHINTHVCF